jgi:hypothetical protein
MRIRTRRLLRRIIVFSTSFILGLVLYRYFRSNPTQSSSLTKFNDLAAVLENALATILLHERNESENRILLQENSASLQQLKSLQDSLICAVGPGSPTHRPFPGFRLLPSSLDLLLSSSSSKRKMYNMDDCFPYSPGKTSSLCSVLSGQNSLFVGPTPTFHLHSHILETTANISQTQTQSCLRPELCTFHHICRSPSTVPIDPGRFKESPSPRDLIETGSSVLRYVLSSTLYHSPDKEDSRYTLPYVDPETGVRIRDGCWIRKARKADVIVLNRGPVPAPASTYTTRDWSFVDKFPLIYTTSRADSKQLHRIINAAVHVTLNTFLHEILQTLRTIRTDKLIRGHGKHILWHGSTLDVGIMDADDPWALYHNTQGEPICHFFPFILTRIYSLFDCFQFFFTTPSCQTFCHITVLFSSRY